MKLSGSYASLVQGVSQQISYDRGPGQCTEQINMVPDPVLGLTRRYGSRWIAEKNLGASPTLAAAVLEDTNNFRTFEYTNGGSDYVLMYRTAAKPVDSPLPPVLVFNRTTGTFLDYERLPTLDDPAVNLLEASGVSAITAVGRYVFMAGHTVVPEVVTTDLWNAPSNKTYSVVWVRGGAYARTYSVTASLAGTDYVFSYKTPTSSYPGTLDTSTVPVFAAAPGGGTTADTEGAYISAVTGTYPAHAKLSWGAWNPTAFSASKAGVAMTNVWPAVPTGTTQYAYNAGATEVFFSAALIGATDVTLSYTHTSTVTNPNYSKQVADITNAYNTAVTQWIGTAAEAITPAAIAEQLRLAAVAVGLTSGVVIGSSLVFDDIDTLIVDDSGDGILIRGVAQEISSADQVSNLHRVGKIVKVKAKTASEAYYLKAIPKDPTATPGDWDEVTWVEAAGVEQQITNGLVYGTVNGTDFAVAGNAARMSSLIGGTHPDYVLSTAGDLDSCPIPYFIGKKISYLGMFQDRLLVGAGGVLRLSRTGDYLNFYRSSILTVPADDAFELLAQGADDDELRFSQPYDKDLVLFGRKRQYILPGRAPVSATSANMPILSSHSDAASLPPLAAGGLLFYGKVDEGSSSVHQIQPSINGGEAPDSFPVSSQLDDYLSGTAIELAKHAKPDLLFCRTTGARNTVFGFQYLDSQGGRKQDAWGRWNFHEALGPVVGMMGTESGLLVFTIREAAGNLWVVADNCPILGGLDNKPYLDSQRSWDVVEAGTGTVTPATVGDWKVAFDSSSEFQFLGRALADAELLFAQHPLGTGATVGILQDARFVPTNPIMRDRNAKAITTGRLTITKFVVTMANSSGYDTEVTTSAGTSENTFNGRILGDPNNLIGRVPVTEYQHSIPIGKETRKFTLAIKAITWLPFTLTAMEWVGQFFNRTTRT